VQIYDAEVWHQAPSVGEIVSLPLSLIAGHTLSGAGQGIGFALATFVVIVVALQVIRALWQKKPGAPWLLLLAALFVVPATMAFAIAHVWHLVFTTRFLIISVPALYLLLAWGATHTRERAFNQLTSIGLLLLMGWGLYNWYFDPSFAKPPVRDAAHQVHRSGLAEAPVLHGTATSHRLFEHYAADLDNYLISGSPMAGRIEGILQDRQQGLVEAESIPFDHYWYLVFPVHSLEFQDAQRRSFDARFIREHEWKKRGIQLYYYVDRDG
jgi:hypothetical protein